MLAWGGFLRYGFQEEAERLAYKWLYMVTKAFVDFNGIVVEKYDVTRPIDPHKVDAEYGSKQDPEPIQAANLSPGPSERGC